MSAVADNIVKLRAELPETVAEIERRATDQLRRALREYIDHDLGGVHLSDNDPPAANYESCEHIHRRFGALAYPEKADEYAAILGARNELSQEQIDVGDFL